MFFLKANKKNENVCVKLKSNTLNAKPRKRPRRKISKRGTKPKIPKRARKIPKKKVSKGGEEEDPKGVEGEHPEET